MAGDPDDILARLRRALPPWFGRVDDSPVLEAFLGGVAAALAWLYSLYAFAVQQARVATSSGGWLDLSSYDVAGKQLPRFSAETDAAYRRRIRLEPLRDRNTVQAISRAVFDITGIPPVVYEGFDVLTNGALGAPTMGLGKAGRWGSTKLGLCVFVAVTMRNSYGIPNRGGFNDPVGGFGHGNFSYVDESEIVGSGATQLDVINAVERVRPAGVNVYVRFVTFGAPEDPSNNVPA